jgi:hypothetical protein
MLQFFAQAFSRRPKRATGASRTRPLRLGLEELERREVPASIHLGHNMIPLGGDETTDNLKVVPKRNEMQVIQAPGNGETAGGFLGSTTTDSPLNAVKTLPSAWSGWSEVPGGGATDRALGSVEFNNRLYLFAKGLGPAIFVNSMGEDTGWSGWSEVPGGGATDQALSPVVFNRQLYLFAKGLGNGIFVNSLGEGTGWSGWREVPGGGATDQALNSVVFNNQLYLFAKGLGLAIFVNSMGEGTGWTGWREVPGGGATDQALSSVVFNDQLYLFAKGLGNGIFVNSMANGALTATNTQILFAAARPRPGGPGVEQRHDDFVRGIERLSPEESWSFWLDYRDDPGSWIISIDDQDWSPPPSVPPLPDFPESPKPDPPPLPGDPRALRSVFLHAMSLGLSSEPLVVLDTVSPLGS